MNFRDRGHGHTKLAPIKVGEEIDVAVEAVGEKGDGIAKKNGFVIFVPNAKEGDQVRIKITKVLTSVGFGEVIGEASAPVQQEVYHRQKPKSQPVQPEALEPVPEDSEDFGEEPEESEQEEAQAPSENSESQESSEEEKKPEA